MVDNKGWRTKIGARSKELPPLKTRLEDNDAVPPTEAAPEPSDRRLHGWRRTISTSRPLTPITPAPPTPTSEDVEDIRSQQSETSTPRRDSKPKLTRYTSFFSTHKEAPTSPVSTEPWSANAPPDREDPWSYVDPIVIMESIHSHMCNNYMTPVPVHYTSGLFQVFDDYRKLRSQKELLENREREALDHSRKVTAQWLESEEMYESEIRRLELLIARGTSGMAGLMQARQGTVVDRRRQHRKTISAGRVSPRYQHMSSAELDAEIKAKTQQALLLRPTSPSGRMIALSRRLTNVGVPQLPIGTPPNTNHGPTLSRKVKSELNLMDLRHVNASQPNLHADMAGWSTSAQDTSQYIVTDTVPLTVHSPECEAFVALRDLGTLVARRKGLDVARFLKALMGLLAPANAVKIASEHAVSNIELHGSVADRDTRVSADDRTPRPLLRRPRSQSYQELGKMRRRHFSFEPGDDQNQELEPGLELFSSTLQWNSSDSELSSSAEFDLFDDGLQRSDDESPSVLSSGVDIPKPSMIPSPIQTAGRVRREDSMSSLQSVFSKSTRDGRHNSRSSVQTAFREVSNVGASRKPKSRSSSGHNSRVAESPLSSKGLNSIVNRQSAAALVAARAVEPGSTLSRSNQQVSTTTSGEKAQRTENNDPTMYTKAPERDAK